MNDESTRAEEELSFSDAMAELERILRGVEAEETDIDVLGEELKRAAELLELCRTKIRRAEVEVTQIVQSLQEDSEENRREAPVEASVTPEEEAPNGEEGNGELPF